MVNIVTGDLHDGKIKSFKKFIINCCVDLYFSRFSMEKEVIKACKGIEVKPSDFHLKQIKKCKLKVAEIKSWSSKKAEEEALKAYHCEVRLYKKSEAEKRALQKLYEKMIRKTKKWKPPQGFRDLKIKAIELLERGIKFDCSASSQPERLSGAEYKQQMIEDIQDSLKHSIKEQEEDIKYYKKFNSWMRDLCKSLK